MTNDQATPRPWKSLNCDQIRGNGQTEEFIADCQGNNHVISQANAQLIVRAVNSHDELVEALKRARKSLCQFGADKDSVSYIDQALAKAEAQ